MVILDDDAAALKLSDVLSVHSLTHAAQPLDLLITRHDQAVSSVSVAQVVLSTILCSQA